nr:phospholipase D-like domain-containing protein [Chitinophagales bacterium]
EVQGIMHNKFVIIDAESPDPNDPIVWTGSTNFSDDQLNKDPNNVIIIQDQSLARAFTMEFDEMFGEKFGSDKLDNTPKEFVVGGKRVEAYFSPGDDIRTNFKKSVAQANYELFFAIMQLTRTDMANAIEDRIYDKVFLAGILDDTSTPENQACFDILAPKMKENLKVDGKSYIFHHKYFIADPNYWDSDPTVWTGSYNWTNSAQVRNDENVVVVHDKNVANIYYQEFVQRFNDLGGILATDDINKNWQLMAWPNPVSNELTIAIFGKNPEKINLQFTDSSGKVLLQKNWTIGTAPSTFKINTANYAAGLYLLTINGQTQKIIIQK